MAALKYRSFSKLLTLLIVLLPLSCTATTAKKTEKININNSVNECIEIRIGSTNTYKNTVLLDTAWQVNKVTGYCGCKSALLSYHSLGLKNGHKTNLSYGVFSSIGRESFSFVLNADKNYKGFDSYILDIGCANPD
jgi:hypothetical protein